MTHAQWLLAKLVVGLFGLGLIALGLAAARQAFGSAKEWRMRQGRRRMPTVQESDAGSDRENRDGGGCFALFMPLLLSLIAAALIAGGIGILTQHGMFRK